jgi:glycosyltransferase involved in cell wall biosynthesis
MYSLSWDILIASWDNPEYLKLTIEGIRKNSWGKHNILVHVNGGNKDTLDFLAKEGISFTLSEENAGLCTGINTIAQYADKDYVCIFDDDMYPLPFWDVALIDFKENYGVEDPSWVTSRCIEPQKGAFPALEMPGGARHPSEFNPSEAEEFRMKYLLSNQPLPEPAICTQSLNPLLLRRTDFERVGGYDTDFDPGVGAELCLAKRFWDIGCRTFVCVMDSFVYHFSSSSLNKVNRATLAQRRDVIFEEKYGITRESFNKDCIRKFQPWSKESS